VRGRLPAEALGRAIDVVCVILPALAALLVRLLSGPHPVDDAYITFRYARNLADGLGLVYNPGEWVLGTTTPGWAMLLAAGQRLGLADLPWLATLLAASCDAITAALLSRWARRLGWSPLGAVLVGLAWALNPMSIAFASAGMESSLFIGLALLALGLAARGRPSSARLGAGLGGLATLVRPEGALLVAAIVAWRALSGRGHWRSAALCGLAPMLAIGLALLACYGSPLPNSIAAKQVAYRGSSPFDNLAAFAVQAGLPGWSTYLLADLPAAAGLLLASLGLATLAYLMWRAQAGLRRGDLIWQPVALFGALYILFYVSVGLRGVRLFPWYLVPIEPVYLLGAAAGLASLGRGAWLAALLVLWQLPALGWQPLLPRGESLDREQLLLQVGQDLAASLPPTARVAAPEIGALGYASRLPILDTTGLVSPASLAYYPLPADELVTDNAIPPDLIHDQQPDAVVTLDAFAQRSLLRADWFAADYQLVAAYTAPVWQSQRLLVFRRGPRPSGS